MISYCIYVPHLPYPFFCQCTFRLFPLAFVNSAAMNVEVHVSFRNRVTDVENNFMVTGGREGGIS